MRFLLVALLALMLIFALTACGVSDYSSLITLGPGTSSSTTSSPVLSETATDAASPPASSATSGTETTVPSAPSPAETEIIDPRIETLIKDFVSSQNAHDWSKFTGLWRKGAQGFLKDFFGSSDNEKNKSGYYAIESAELLSITNDFKPEGKVTTDYELKEYKEFRTFIAKVKYHLTKDFWGYTEGEDTLELVLSPESGTWKISQDCLMIDQNPDDFHASQEKSSNIDGKVHFKKTITGYYLSTVYGDYAHLVIMTVDGGQIQLWKKCAIGTDTPFLQKMQITWTNYDSYVDEADAVINKDAATDIKLIN